MTMTDSKTDSNRRAVRTAIQALLAVAAAVPLLADTPGVADLPGYATLVVAATALKPADVHAVGGPPSPTVAQGRIRRGRRW